VRVIAGRARGTPLQAPPGRRTRPTADRLKAAIFSMLEAEAFKRGVAPPPDAPAGTLLVGVAWPRVLDLYAGSGALGIEALSRGAQWADFVEADPAARRALEANLRRTRLADRARVHALTAAAAISTWQEPYDLILLDPPYADPTIPAILEALGRSALLKPSSVIVLEHARQFVPPERAGRLVRQRTRYHGGSGVTVYTVAPAEAA
jgi:16S rRNA (guanine966-N2)-methyltransferase